MRCLVGEQILQRRRQVEERPSPQALQRVVAEGIGGAIDDQEAVGVQRGLRMPGLRRDHRGAETVQIAAAAVHFQLQRAV
ncbi:hypothetical protein NB713_003103 [Xanthomonas sacchari]|nr:hypothetical protein [Xanthomonas sacchari]